MILQYQNGGRMQNGSTKKEDDYIRGTQNGKNYKAPRSEREKNSGTFFFS